MRTPVDPQLLMGPLVVPDEAIRFILFQRTAYLRFPKTRAYRLASKVLPFSIYNRLVSMEAKSGSERTKGLYEEDMRREYLTIQDSLSAMTCHSVLDIGCGIAGIDVFLARHFKDSCPEFYLLDKTDVAKSVFYRFESKGAFYNSLELAEKTLIENGVAKEKVHLVEANDNNEISLNRQVDLVISLISWGFHYPVETYLDRVSELLSDHGSLIIDVRKKTGGLELLREKFSKVRVIVDEKKYQRVVASK